MVKARLPEPQTWDLKTETAHRRSYVPYGVGDGLGAQGSIPRKCSTGTTTLRPNHATHPSSMGHGRTGHLTAPHLLHCVNTGSPLRAALNRPAWRRSRHSSQTLTVMRQTAAGVRTVMAKTIRVTGTGTPADRVKGGAFAEYGNLHDDAWDR